eukprot:2533646-Pyramimonas_sp.AAC.1
MGTVLLLLEVDRARDRGILGLPLLEADDRGRTCVLSGGLAASRSSSSRSSCSTNSVSIAGGLNISSPSTTAGADGCQSPGATAVR